jgi:PRTRC genetic system protein E
MLQTLLPLLRPGDTLGLTIACEAPETTIGDTVTPARYRVNVLPKLFTLDGETGPDRLALNQPLSLTGSLAEIDSPEFVATLHRYSASTTDLRHTIDDVEAAHKAAKESKGRAGKPRASVGPVPSPGAETEENETGDETDNKTPDPRPKTPAAKPEKPADPTPSLI